MKLLLNECVTFATKQLLESLGHDIIHLAESGPRNQSDPENLELAREKGRTFVTVDKKFFLRKMDLACLIGHPGVVLIRMSHRDFTDMINPLKSFFISIEQESTQNCLHILRLDEYEKKTFLVKKGIVSIIEKYPPAFI